MTAEENQNPDGNVPAAATPDLATPASKPQPQQPSQPHPTTVDGATNTPMHAENRSMPAEFPTGDSQNWSDSPEAIDSLSGKGPKIIPFRTLCRCGDEVWIENEGAIYRLRRTKLGKLILTK